MWSYRIVEMEEEGEKYLAIGEVYFNSKREPYGFCQAEIDGQNIEELKEIHQMMLKAFEYPIIRKTDLTDDLE